MTIERKQIAELKANGFSNDSIYESMAAELSLYHVAFFGHGLKTKEETRKAKRKLNSVWNKIVNA